MFNFTYTKGVLVNLKTVKIATNLKIAQFL